MQVLRKFITSIRSLISQDRDENQPIGSFYEFLAVLERRRVITTFAIGILIYPSFGITDAMVWPEQASQLLFIRFLVTAIILPFMVLCYFIGYKYWIISTISSSVFTLAAVSVAYMTHLTGGLTSPYYAGINVVIVVAAVVFTWPMWVSVLSYSIILMAYYVPIFMSGQPIIEHHMWNNSFFLIMTVVVSLLGSSLRNKLAFNEYTQRKALVESNKELKELHAFKDQMFQNVSHEFRTPLTLMLAPVEMMLEKMEHIQDPHETHLQTVRRHSLRLLNLINDLLDLAKLGKKSLVNNAIALDVGALLGRILHDAQIMATSKGVELTIDLPKEQLVYMLDPRHIEKIILNLLSNALKFTSSGGTITLSCQENDQGLEIKVEDTGIGIPKEALSRIFERFQQVDGTTTRKFGGTGIGLSLVWELVHLQGGTIEVESTPDVGSCFKLLFTPDLKSSLPAVAVEDAEASSVVALGRSAAYAALEQSGEDFKRREAGGSGPFVLVAEDNSDLNQQLVDILCKEYRVVAVPDGKEAYNTALKQKPDIIISDVMMPHMDGIELSRKLRERSDFKDVPIVLLSAHSDLEARITGRQAGVDTYLTKPFHPRELLATVDGLLRSRMRLVGSYMLYEKLGEGGQSKVFLGRHIKTDETAAVKIISPEGNDDQEARQLIRKEQEVLARIAHTNIVSVLEHGDHDDNFYLVMELLQGLSLDELLEYNRQLSVGTVATVGEVISDALAVVHEKGLVHRDIKSSNIMLVDKNDSLKNRLRIIDFGTVFESADVNQESDKVIGTLPLLAPEIILGEKPSVQSDIYALGVSLFYLLSGNYPFRGESVAEIASNIHSQETPHIRSFRRDVPQDIDQIIYTCMNRHVDHRYQTMQDLRNDCKPFATNIIDFNIPTAKKLNLPLTPGTTKIL